MAAIAIADISSEQRAGNRVAHAPPSTPLGPRRDVIQIFEAEPDLVADLDQRTAAFLTQRVVAPTLCVEPGPWEPPSRDAQTSRSLGLLVIDGFLLRTLELRGRRCPELVGPGDVLRPWDDIESVADGASWTALGGASIAVLDEQFCAIGARWPSIIAQLLARSIQRSRSLAVNLAIVHVRHADLRLHMLLWQLAERWARVTSDGVHLPIRLTHEMLADLACMRRPTASSALSVLVRRGEVVRRDDGTWLLTGPPPSAQAGAGS